MKTETIDTIAIGIAARHITEKYGSCNASQIIETIKALREANFLVNEIPEEIK